VNSGYTQRKVIDKRNYWENTNRPPQLTYPKREQHIEEKDRSSSFVEWRNESKHNESQESEPSTPREAESKENRQTLDLATDMDELASGLDRAFEGDVSMIPVEDIPQATGYTTKSGREVVPPKRLQVNKIDLLTAFVKREIEKEYELKKRQGIVKREVPIENRERINTKIRGIAATKIKMAKRVKVDRNRKAKERITPKGVERVVKVDL
jgi:hypothetical protein